LTNSVSVGKVYDGLFLWQLEQAAEAGEDDIEAMRRVTIPVVAETFDGLLNDISASVITKETVYAAIDAAGFQTSVLEGNHGGGTAMRCHGYKGGTGTSSRIIPGDGRDYALGVLVQANHGQLIDLCIGGVPIGELLVKEEEISKGTASLAVPMPVGGKAAEGSEFDLLEMICFYGHANNRTQVSSL
jgi:D-aminopeptidase